MRSFTAIVEPADISGKVVSPSSKSMMIRALAAAWMAGGQSRITRPSTCRDARDVAASIEMMGTVIRRKVDVWETEGAPEVLPGTEINIGESGLGARMFVPLMGRFSFPVTVTGRGSLLKRPMNMLIDPLNKLGVSVTATNGKLPVTVQGPMKGNRIIVDGSQSSQFVTGLLMALPTVEEDSMLTVESLKSRPYIDLTLEVLNHFGIRVSEPQPSVFNIVGRQRYMPANIAIEGDWSGAAFLLVAGSIAGEITVSGLNMDSRQADRKILDALNEAGVKITVSGDSVSVDQGPVHSFKFDITHCPDLAPPLVALAAYGRGKSVLYGAGRLLTKESNRARTLASEAAKLGIRVEQEDDTLVVYGGKVRGGEVFAHNDHRIAMASAIMALRATNRVSIRNAECVDKSYPQFFHDLKKIGGKVYESFR